MPKLLAEFIGTFFLVFTIALSGNPLAIGIVLMIMIYAFGPLSGGHFNPAVTIGVLLNKEINTNLALKYIVAQLLGSLSAAFVFTLITNSYFSPGIPSSNTFVIALVIEIIFTFALVLVVLNVAVNKKVKDNQYFGLAIGLTIFVAASSGGMISGGVFNPAVGVMPLLLDFSNLSTNWANIALYILGPILGAILAAFVYKYMNGTIKLKLR